MEKQTFRWFRSVWGIEKCYKTAEGCYVDGTGVTLPKDCRTYATEFEAVFIAKSQPKGDVFIAKSQPKGDVEC